jgi:hypothetical protein
MLYAAIFDFTSGVLTGSVYKIQVLLSLLALVAIKSAISLHCLWLGGGLVGGEVGASSDRLSGRDLRTCRL